MPIHIVVVLILYFAALNVQCQHINTYDDNDIWYAVAMTWSLLLGLLVGLVSLLYYGYKDDWGEPLVMILLGSFGGAVLFAIIDKAGGVKKVSLSCFFIWPICAYLMFHAPFR